MNKRILSAFLIMSLLFVYSGYAFATPISDAKSKKKEAEDKLSSEKSKISNIEKEKKEAEEEAEAFNEELEELLLSIEVITADIQNKEQEVAEAKEEYEEAVVRADEQQKAMQRRIKFMYEKGDMTYVEMLLKSGSFSEAINKAEYVEKIYTYDRLLLYQYEETREEVKEKEINLENELAELEEIKADAEEQQEVLQEKIEEYQETIENFAEKLSEAKAKAKQYQTEITKQTNSIKQIEQENKRKAEEELKKKLEAEAKKKAEEEAKKKAEAESKKTENDSSDSGEIKVEDNTETTEETESVNDTSEEKTEEEKPEEKPASSSSGSAKGREIANYGCQFVGNPYVSGGTSLTDGCDCSGFTSAVYSHFGISLPRTSGSQGSYGTAVSYADAVPGDIIYYGGHVGIYIGNGQIVHASTPATGIKITNALYRSIISVRRIVN